MQELESRHAIMATNKALRRMVRSGASRYSPVAGRVNAVTLPVDRA